MEYHRECIECKTSFVGHKWNALFCSRPCKDAVAYRKRRGQILLQKKEYHARTRPQRLVSMRDWYARNRDAVLINKREYWENLPTDKKTTVLKKHRLTIRRWVSENPEQWRAIRRRRRARLRNAKGIHTTEQWLSRVEYHGWCCRYCLVPLTSKTLTQDHVKPVSKGGSEWPANLVPACQSCNSSKNGRDWKTFYERRGLLCRVVA